MTGRIKRKQIQANFVPQSHRRDGQCICPLCGRNIPPSQRDLHHLTPKSHGGRETAVLHRICHRQIHALFTESELARQYNTIDQLKLDNQVQAFMQWVAIKPDDFYERTRKSRRLKPR